MLRSRCNRFKSPFSRRGRSPSRLWENFLSSKGTSQTAASNRFPTTHPPNIKVSIIGNFSTTNTKSRQALYGPPPSLLLSSAVQFQSGILDGDDRRSRGATHRWFCNVGDENRGPLIANYEWLVAVKERKAAKNEQVQRQHCQLWISCTFLPSLCYSPRKCWYKFPPQIYTQKKKPNLKSASLFTSPVITLMDMRHIMVLLSKLSPGPSDSKQRRPGICTSLSLSNISRTFLIHSRYPGRYADDIETTFQLPLLPQKGHSNHTATILDPFISPAVSKKHRRI